jgi:hypothetical protein
VHLLVAFRQGLAEGGFVEGQNVVVEYPSDRCQYDLLPAMAADLVRRRVNVLTTADGEPSALVGLAESFKRPGGRAITSNRRGRAFRQVSRFTQGRQNVLYSKRSGVVRRARRLSQPLTVLPARTGGESSCTGRQVAGACSACFQPAPPA